MDNGPEFLGERFTERDGAHGMAMRYVQLGKPNRNVRIDRYNPMCRDGVRDTYLFGTFAEMHEATHWRLMGCDEERCHDSLEERGSLECLT